MFYLSSGIIFPQSIYNHFFSPNIQLLNINPSPVQNLDKPNRAPRNTTPLITEKVAPSLHDFHNHAGFILVYPTKHEQGIPNYSSCIHPASSIPTMLLCPFFCDTWRLTTATSCPHSRGIHIGIPWPPLRPVIPHFMIYFSSVPYVLLPIMSLLILHISTWPQWYWIHCPTLLPLILYLSKNNEAVRPHYKH
jgi:hypothetical protein